jgi:hypothetical protein
MSLRSVEVLQIRIGVSADPDPVRQTNADPDPYHTLPSQKWDFLT